MHTPSSLYSVGVALELVVILEQWFSPPVSCSNATFNTQASRNYLRVYSLVWSHLSSSAPVFSPVNALPPLGQPVGLCSWSSALGDNSIQVSAFDTDKNMGGNFCICVFSDVFGNIKSLSFQKHRSSPRDGQGGGCTGAFLKMFIL